MNLLNLKKRSTDLFLNKKLFQIGNLSTELELQKCIDIRIKTLYCIYYNTDPILRIQLVWKKIVRTIQVNRLSDQLIKLQSRFRGRKFRERITRELNQLIIQDNLTAFDPIDLQVNAYTNSTSANYEDYHGFYADIISKYIRLFIFRQKRFRARKTIKAIIIYNLIIKNTY